MLTLTEGHFLRTKLLQCLSLRAQAINSSIRVEGRCLDHGGSLLRAASGCVCVSVCLYVCMWFLSHGTLIITAVPDVTNHMKHTS